MSSNSIETLENKFWQWNARWAGTSSASHQYKKLQSWANFQCGVCNPKYSRMSYSVCNNTHPHTTTSWKQQTTFCHCKDCVNMTSVVTSYLIQCRKDVFVFRSLADGENVFWVLTSSLWPHCSLTVTVEAPSFLFYVYYGCSHAKTFLFQAFLLAK